MAEFEHSTPESRCEDQLRNLKNKEAEQRNMAAQVFDQLHDEGANRYGMLWLRANNMIADLRSKPYLPTGEFGQADRRIDALLTECAMRIAEYMHLQVMKESQGE